VPPAKGKENLPVKSDIPALVLAAQYDAYTPPAWGRGTAANLKNSFFFEVPWAGHGPTFNSPSCVADMIAGFFDEPSTRPNADCLDKIGKYFKFNVKKNKN
jgi:pimeloyl-ACP methyl ester carboxylesterase